MSFFKELFTLVKLLFTRISGSEIEVLPMKHFPFSGYAYMMWCGKLIYREGKSYLSRPSDIDLNHESIHLAQAKDCGTWVSYYLSYFWNWLCENPFTSPSKSAYYTNKYEVEAYAKEDDLSYLQRRKRGMVDKYKLMNGKKIFRNCGSSTKFKQEIKEMFADY